TLTRSSLIALWAATLIPMSWSATRPAQDDLVRSIHRIRQDGSGYIASNPAQGFTVRFQEGRAEFVRETGRFSLALAGEEAPTSAVVRDNRIDLVRGNVTEWFINDAHGLEQGFTVVVPRDSGSLQVALDVSGDYTPAIDGGEIVLHCNGKPLLRYAGLRSWHAAGRQLNSRALVQGSRIKLIVDDRGARYPVTIDPVVQE